LTYNETQRDVGKDIWAKGKKIQDSSKMFELNLGLFEATPNGEVNNGERESFS
jgi:hypothetical protein